MEDQVVWLIGAALTLVTVIGGIVARDRFIMRLVSSEIAAAKADAQQKADALHERVNRVRDDYVRRSDMDNHITRLEQIVAQLSSDLKSSSAATNQRLDVLMTHLVERSKRDDHRS